jgi:preprotein translocase subunit SecG
LLYALYTIHVIICLFLIMVVLLQQGKGADLSVFGGGGTQTAFGARGAATLLHKLTVFSFVAFIFTTIGIGFLKSGGTSGSVMTDVPVEAPEEATEEAAPETTDPAAAVEGLSDAVEETSGDIVAPVSEPDADEGGEAGTDGGDNPPG